MNKLLQKRITSKENIYIYMKGIIIDKYDDDDDDWWLDDTVLVEDY